MAKPLKPAAKTSPPDVALPETRSEKKAVWRRAVHLSREVPWLLYRHKATVPLALQWELADATRGLRAAMARPKAERPWGELARTVDRLDRDTERHLGRFRKSRTWQYVESLGGALLIAGFVRAFMFEPFTIPSGSMLPNLRIGDYVFVSKYIYGMRVPFTTWRFFGFRQPVKGEIVVFEHPHPKQSDHDVLIKRILATPGDRVRMADNRWVVNGEPISVLQRGGAPETCRQEPGRGCWSWSKANATAVDGVKVVPAERGCPCIAFDETDPVRKKTWVTQVRAPESLCVCDEPGAEALVDRAQAMPLDEWERMYEDVCLAGRVPICNHPEWPLAEDEEALVAELPKGAQFVDDASGRRALVIPDGHVMVLGDNRDQSADGRYWGLVPIDHIKGRAELLGWAKEDFGTRWLRPLR